MHYVHVLKSKKDEHMYVGCTNNLQKRIAMHNKGNVISTRDRKPVALLFYEAFIDSDDAFSRERWLKTGWGRNRLRTMLRNTLKI